MSEVGCGVFVNDNRFSGFEVEKMLNQWKWIGYGKARDISKESERLVLV